jgi:PEP-CTERM motif
MFKRRFLIFGLFAVMPVIALHLYVHRSHGSESIQKHSSKQGAVIPPAVRSLRPHYPYSVVPGGLYGPAELRAVTQKDALVRDHYADFNVNAAQLVKLTDDQYQYVSFRLGNKIFWTNKKLRIPKGEILLTDGNNYARTRCGNRLSAVPKGNTTPRQPAEALLSLPPFRPEELPQLSLAQPAPVLPFDGSQAPPFVPPALRRVDKGPESWAPLQVPPGMVPIAAPPYAATPHHSVAGPPGPPGSPPPHVVPPPVTPPVVAPVPEPGSAYLLGLGLVLALFAIKRMSRYSANQSRE